MAGRKMSFPLPSDLLSPLCAFVRGNDLKENGARALGTALACLTLLEYLDLR